MKKLILLFIAFAYFSNYSFAQHRWYYFETNDPFDGLIKMVNADGKNGCKGAENPNYH